MIITLNYANLQVCPSCASNSSDFLWIFVSSDGKSWLFRHSEERFFKHSCQMAFKNTTFYLLLACYQYSSGLLYEFRSSGTLATLSMNRSLLPYTFTRCIRLLKLTLVITSMYNIVSYKVNVYIFTCTMFNYLFRSC